MNTIFLDIDGVLNNYKSGTFIFCNSETYGLDINNIYVFNRILNNVDCQIVLSTSWRKYPLDKELEDKYGLKFKSPLKKVIKYYKKYIHGSCPHLKNGTKQQDILYYLNNCADNVTDFVILDDDPNQGLQYFGEQFFRTDFHVGLTKEIADKVINYFKGQ